MVYKEISDGVIPFIRQVAVGVLRACQLKCIPEITKARHVSVGWNDKANLFVAEVNIQE